MARDLTPVFEPVEPHVWIRFEEDAFGGSFVCGDEDGEFARADHVETILRYVTDLILGPGTVRRTGLMGAAPTASSASE